MKSVLVLVSLLGLAACASAPSADPATSTASTSQPTRSSQPPTPPAVTPSPDSQSITIGWVGDTTMGSMYGRPPGKGTAMFAGVAPLLSAPDLMWGNLEGVLSDRPASICEPRTPPTPGPAAAPSRPSCFAFVAPPAYAAGLKAAGFDGMNVCNNHGYDAGVGGLNDTVAALRRQGLGASGLIGRLEVVRTHGVRVAFLGFSTQSWWHLTTDLRTVRRVVAQAAKQADVVVVTLHGGAEGADKTHTPARSEQSFGQERGFLPAFAHAAIDAGADLILGSGPHVLRGMEIYKHRLVAYSLGNFAGNSNFVTGGVLSLSGMLQVRLGSDGRLEGADFHSLILSPTDWPSQDASGAALRLVRELSSQDFGAAAAQFDTQGRLLNR